MPMFVRRHSAYVCKNKGLLILQEQSLYFMVMNAIDSSARSCFNHLMPWSMALSFISSLEYICLT
uniref:Uncharacterized protein n=1 Tax=Arundo donax TaxID=35708 RepID=A0A0A9FHK5_ARUDO